jgi:hypothetical protein
MDEAVGRLHVLASGIVMATSVALRRSTPAIDTDVVKVGEGKIVFFRFVPDFDDEQTATFFGLIGIGPRADIPSVRLHVFAPI